jgi:hypothetical protein
VAHRNRQGGKISQKSGPEQLSSEQIVEDLRRAMRKQYSAEEKIRIVLDGLCGEHGKKRGSQAACKGGCLNCLAL